MSLSKMASSGSLRKPFHSIAKQSFVSKSRYSTSVLVTGANKGIGLEFCSQYLAKQYRVFACCREPFIANELDELHKENPDQLSIRQLDVANDHEIMQLADSLKNTPIDILVLNAGVKGDRVNHGLGVLYRQDLLDTINVNCISSLLIAQSLFENVKMSQRKQIVGISSLMGSIADNEQDGGRVAYRVSKTALNAVFQELKLKGKQFGVHSLLLHPGWVQTDMGGPNALKTTQQAVTQMIGVIDDYKKLKSGGFYNYEAQMLPW